MYLTIFGKPRYLGLVVADEGTSFEKGERLLVESSRGVEVAVVAGAITERQEALYRAIDNRQEGQPSSDAGLQNVTFLHRVEPEDLENEEKNRADESGALILARQVLGNHDLDMKLVDVEYLNDRKKLFLYFTSEQRVDFRAYVRDLAREFRTRIELRQIGVRDESKVVKGLGSCGKACCCSYWLQRFMPIGIRMVKEQNLALNPTKISGLCGRLMCCMSFEQENYRELWSNLPSHGAKIKNEEGTWILLGVDVATGTCSIKGPSGFINIPVGMYQKFKETILAGEAWSNEANGLDEKGCPLVKAKDESVPAELASFVQRCSGCPRHAEERSLSDDIQSACEGVFRTFAEKLSLRDAQGASENAQKNAVPGEFKRQAFHKSRRRKKALRWEPGDSGREAPRAENAQRVRPEQEKNPSSAKSPAAHRHVTQPRGAERGEVSMVPSEKKAVPVRRRRAENKPGPNAPESSARDGLASKTNLHSRRRRGGSGAPRGAAPGGDAGQSGQKGTE